MVDVSDPSCPRNWLAGAEVLWSQSPDAYLASHAAGDDDLYRSSYAYNAFGEVTAVTSPFADPRSTPYASEVLATSGLVGYWRLGETSGTSAADSSGSGHPATLSGGVTKGQAGALVGDANGAMSLDGTSGHLLAPGAAIPNGPYTLAVWVKATAADPNAGLLGQWAGGGAMLWLDGSGAYGLAHTGSGSDFLSSGVAPRIGAWDLVVGVFDGAELRLYVNGTLAASLATTTNPGTAAVPVELGALPPPSPAEPPQVRSRPRTTGPAT